MKKWLLFLITVFITTNLCAQEEWVVINGVKWATRNVDMPGTFAVNSEDAGMFYQWNRRIGWSSTDPLINSNGETMWDNTTPSGTTWEKENDPCPSGWRVPTKKELQGLVNSGSHWSILNDIAGRIFGSGNNTIFLPAVGYRRFNYGDIYTQGTLGYYWSCNISSINAHHLYFSNNSVSPDDTYFNNAYGFAVRCVADESVGVNEVSVDTETAIVIGYFDILGKKLNEEPKQGIYIILYDNGKTKLRLK
ncbi:MAG: fibrobacter succinogenes major paralogous domain-containing protein [Bacteroidales bacterium]|jgi:uncharacterized protein (TIGR02145 family)|nr:fibrobacter succinogenes major paralogous domain-containing protein [Bacteroidales bacterium]